MRLLEFLKEQKEYYDLPDMIDTEMKRLKSNDLSKKNVLRQDHITQHIHDRLKKRGFRQIGSGAFASVYTKPNIDYVLKVVAADDTVCTKAYLVLGRYSNKNRHLPKVRKVKSISYDDDNYIIAEIEKLYPLDISKLKLTRDEKYNAGFLSFIMLEIISDYEFGNSYKELIKKVHKNSVIRKKASDMGLYSSSKRKEYIEMAQGIYLDKGTWFHEVFHPIKQKWLEEYSHTPFIKALKIIHTLNSNYDGELDIHRRNVMMRKDRTFVFSDPVVG